MAERPSNDLLAAGSDRPSEVPDRPSGEMPRTSDQPSNAPGDTKSAQPGAAEIRVAVSAVTPPSEKDDIGRPSTSCCYIIFLPLLRLMGVVFFVFNLVAWCVFYWFALFLDLICCCRKPRIPTAAEAYTKASYRPFGSPSDPILCGDRPYKIAVIGAGWAGVCLAKELREKGVEVQVYEANSDVGGTWFAGWAYHGLGLHATTWSTEFHDFPYVPEEKRDVRLSAAEVQQYIKDYCTKFELEKIIKFNSRVTKVLYSTTTQKNTLEIQPAGSTECKGGVSTVGEYDLVVYTGFAAAAALPHWRGQSEFKGQILHTAQLQTPVFQSIVDSKAKVLVVGGSKSGVDVLTSFARAGHKAVVWASRSTYTFVRYRTIFHRRTFRGMLRGFLYVNGLLLAMIFPTLAAIFLLFAYMTVVPAGFSLNLRNFHLGILDDDQIRVAGEATRVTSDIDHFTANGAVLKNGEEVACNYVVCATGYRTGLPSIALVVDGQTVSVPGYVRLYEGLVLPNVPRFVFGFANGYDFGAKRAVCLADHTMTYLVSYPDPSRVPRCTRWNSIEASTLFGVNFLKSEKFVSVFLGNFFRLIMWGRLTPCSLLSHVFGVFVLNRLNVLQLRHPKRRAPIRSSMA